METKIFEQVLEHIGYQFYVARHQKRETITCVAKNIGVSHPVISKIENGRYKSISLQLIIKLMDYYSIKTETIFMVAISG